MENHMSIRHVMQAGGVVHIFDLEHVVLTT